ncbi:MAG: hypothetical protein AMS22_04730 [Thiotrichales bacterium SG8_50]|nr:MAG: hypothetical protein AMS22_04730 [Thiotrichales bacterium SG8_50]
MTPWILVDSAQVPGTSEELQLYKRCDEFSIKLKGRGELMCSRVHGSEVALAELGCSRLTAHSAARVLIGGLGMGFTLAATLQQLGASAEVVVAELVPAVVEWNRGPLADLAGRPLTDARVTVRIGDVARILTAERQAYDAILLDVDNGPEGLTRKDNDWLYAVDGLAASFAALRPLGVLAVWSAGPDRHFAERMRKVGFDVEETRVRAHASRRGAQHTIWLAGRPV